MVIGYLGLKPKCEFNQNLNFTKRNTNYYYLRLKPKCYDTKQVPKCNL